MGTLPQFSRHLGGLMYFAAWSPQPGGRGIPISFGCALLRVIVTAIYFVGGGTMGGARRRGHVDGRMMGNL